MRWPWSRKARRTFNSSPMPIDQMWLELSRRQGTTVTRGEALSVPAVQRGRNLVCSIATLPLVQHRPDNTVERSPLLDQIDPNVPNVVTIAQTVEDLLFESISWWMITAQDFAGFPVAARHLDVATVSVNPPAGRNPAPLPSGIDPRGAVVWVDGQPVSASRVIRFDSPNPALLKTGGRAIRRAILLDKAAAMYADDPRPLDYFTPSQDADELDDNEMEDILARWKAARKARSTAWVPAALTYNSVDAPSPAELQLVELQRQAVLDIANEMGIDPEDLGLSTTSRTYSNDVDRRRNKLNEVLAPFMRAVTDRLSMGDVTRRGYTVRFDTSEFLMPNPQQRWGNYQTALNMKAMTVAEIREAEGMPPLPEDAFPDPPPPPDEPGDEETNDEESEQVDATRPAAHTFNDDSRLMFADLPLTTFTVDRPNRVIEGVALPYGKIASQGGYRFRFDRGSLRVSDVPRVKLLRDHDTRQPLGKATQLKDTPTGFLSRFKVARGPEGDRALELAEDGVLDGLSVGVDFDLRTDTVPDPDNEGVLLIRRADLREVSLTPMPNFDDARVTKVAASRTHGGNMPCSVCGQVHAEGVACPTETTENTPADPPEPTGLTLSQDQLTLLLSQPGAIEAITQAGAPPEPDTPDGGLTLTAEQVQNLIASGGLATLLGIPDLAQPAPAPEPERPTPVDPTRHPVTFVREELPYRFDRAGNFEPSEFDFSTDLHEMALARDHRGEETVAGKRVMGLFGAVFGPARHRFDVVGTDVNELNPTINRQDMYIDQQDFRYPIWTAIDKGAPPNGVQPFRFPKFNSATGLVDDHTEGTEPTTGSFTTTSQTVTPTPVSGKASITREVWDMGGNPAVSTLIFNQMVRGYREGLEEAAADHLEGLAGLTQIDLGIATVDEVLIANWDEAVAGLQFTRGYDYSVFVIEEILFKAFVAAVDGNGRKLVPQLNPQNASSQAARRFVQLDLAGVLGVPSWALTSTAAAENSSFLFDPMFVSGWASAPTRLEFPGTDGANAAPVAFVDLAVWGYKAVAVTDDNAVREVIYDETV